MKRRTHALSAGLAVLALIACGASVAAPAGLLPRNEANLVVSRFLVAAAIGDRPTACSLFPGNDTCTSTTPLRGPAEFKVTAIELPRSGRARVAAVVGGSSGRFELERSGSSFVITGASFAATPNAHASTGVRATASLVVSRFLVAATDGDSRTACALYPSYITCAQRKPIAGSGAFRLVDVSLADPERPAVFANIDGLRGYFLLERRGRSYVITSAGLD
jgi:hypothetical protein